MSSLSSSYRFGRMLFNVLMLERNNLLQTDAPSQLTQRLPFFQRNGEWNTHHVIITITTYNARYAETRHFPDLVNGAVKRQVPLWDLYNPRQTYFYNMEILELSTLY